MTTVNLGKIKPIYKGAYAGVTTYRPLDFTVYNGNLYICKLESVGNLPTNTAYFDPLVVATAGGITNTPAGNIAATTVQAALNELDAEKVATTAVIAIAQGGSGATTANAAADALGAFRKGTLLGTVSQSAGVPTGAVIERGSNANGEYVRWADGTQICTATVTVPAWIATGTSSVAWVFPAVFVALPSVTALLNTNQPQNYNCGTFGVLVESAAIAAGGSAASGSAATGVTYAQATGRWF